MVSPDSTDKHQVFIMGDLDRSIMDPGGQCLYSHQKPQEKSSIK
jgi:hypothetical protein